MNGTQGRNNSWLLHLAAAGLLVLMLARVTVSIARESRFRHESGVWTALAIDAAHGVIYRPLVGPLGYGGTRYFPGQFLLHSFLIRAGMDPIRAGFAIVIPSAVLLLSAMYLLMRRLGVPSGLCATICVLATGTAGAEMALTMIRGDLFPAALNLAALAICAYLLPVPRSIDTREKSDDNAGLMRAVLAGILFGLAFLSKVTTVFGVVAAFIALWLQGDRRCRRTALLLGGTAALVAVVGLVGVQIASHGAFYENLRATASAGRAGWTPMRFPIKLAEVCIGHDPLGFAVVMLGASVFLAGSWRRQFDLPAVLFIVTALVTIPLFLSPGIDVNHLLDLQIFALVLVAVQMARDAHTARLLTGALVTLAVAAIITSWTGLMGDLPRRAQSYSKLARECAPPGAAGPLLTDFALLPVLNGQSPYLLDDFMLPVLAQSHPEVQRDLYEKLDRGFFCCVVLKIDPSEGYHIVGWGDDFLKHLLTRYVRDEDRQGFQIYRRRDVSP